MKTKDHVIAVAVVGFMLWFSVFLASGFVACLIYGSGAIAIFLMHVSSISLDRKLVTARAEVKELEDRLRGIGVSDERLDQIRQQSERMP